MQSKEILESLDQAAAEFNFPMLDNANTQFIAGRCRGFRRGSEYGLVFELLVYHTPAGTFSVGVYGYGPLVGGKQGFIDSLPAIGEAQDHPLWDEEGEWIGGDQVRVVAVFGEKVHVVPVAGATDALTMGAREVVVLSHGDEVDEASFARALVRELGVRRLMPEELLFQFCPMLRDAVEVVRLSNWDHPDVAVHAPPSGSRALVALTRFLTGESPSFEYDHAGDNVDWRRWASE